MTEHAQPSHRPLDPFAQTRRELEDSTHLSAHASPFVTPCELTETDDAYVVRLDVPGVSEKDLRVDFHGDSLTISGERRARKTDEKGLTRYTERRYGAFSRTLAMPTLVKPADIRAHYKHGVMVVHLPKAEKTASREIKVVHES